MFARLLLPLAALLAMASASASAQHPVVPPGELSGLTPEPAAVDLGDVYDGEPARGQVLFRNTSSTDWPVASVRTTCGCTLATVHGPDGAELPLRATQSGVPLVTLKPGEALTIDVEVTTANVRGAVEKHVEVAHLDPTHPIGRVPVKARISKAIQVTPELLNLGKITKNQRVEQTLTLQAQAIGDWSIDGFTSAIESQPLPAGWQFKVLDTEGAERRVQVLSEGGRPTGVVTARLRILIGHARVKHLDVMIYGTVEPDVAFDTGNTVVPETINLEQMQAGESVTKTLTITNRDPSIPYRLDSVEIQTKADLKAHFTATIRTLQDGVSYAVDLNCDGRVLESAPDTTYIRGTLLLKATHPELPNHSIQFQGWIRRG
ncbi:MAG: hypothetical protein ACT4PU_02295 [Planctomycetota bacterium]